MEFTHLHGHSTYSFLEAIGTPAQIVSRAKELGFTAIAITDYFSMYGAINMYEICKENGINPIIGSEIGFILDINGYNKVGDIGNICLLVKNNEGYQNMMKIVSIANQEGSAGKPKIDPNILKKHNLGIIGFMGGKESRIGKMIYRSENDEKIVEIIKIIQNCIGAENVYLQVIAQDENTDPITKKINTKIIELGKKLNIPIMTGNCYNYTNKSDKETREMALAIKDNKRMFDPDRRKPIGEFHIMSGNEIFEILSKNGYPKNDITNRMETNQKIGQSINFEIPMGQGLFPKYQSPENIKKLYSEIKDGLICE